MFTNVFCDSFQMHHPLLLAHRLAVNYGNCVK